MKNLDNVPSAAASNTERYPVKPLKVKPFVPHGELSAEEYKAAVTILSKRSNTFAAEVHPDIV